MYVYTFRYYMLACFKKRTFTRSVLFIDNSEIKVNFNDYQVSWYVHSGYGDY